MVLKSTVFQNDSTASPFLTFTASQVIEIADALRHSVVYTLRSASAYKSACR